MARGGTQNNCDLDCLLEGDRDQLYSEEDETLKERDQRREKRKLARERTREKKKAAAEQEAPDPKVLETGWETALVGSASAQSRMVLEELQAPGTARQAAVLPALPQNKLLSPMAAFRIQAYLANEDNDDAASIAPTEFSTAARVSGQENPFHGFFGNRTWRVGQSDLTPHSLLSKRIEAKVSAVRSPAAFYLLPKSVMMKLAQLRGKMTIQCPKLNTIPVVDLAQNDHVVFHLAAKQMWVRACIMDVRYEEDITIVDCMDLDTGTEFSVKSDPPPDFKPLTEELAFDGRFALFCTLEKFHGRLRTPTAEQTEMMQELVDQQADVTAAFYKRLDKVYNGKQAFIVRLTDKAENNFVKKLLPPAKDDPLANIDAVMEGRSVSGESDISIVSHNVPDRVPEEPEPAEKEEEGDGAEGEEDESNTQTEEGNEETSQEVESEASQLTATIAVNQSEAATETADDVMVSQQGKEEKENESPESSASAVSTKETKSEASQSTATIVANNSTNLPDDVINEDTEQGDDDTASEAASDKTLCYAVNLAEDDFSVLSSVSNPAIHVVSVVQTGRNVQPSGQSASGTASGNGSKEIGNPAQPNNGRDIGQDGSDGAANEVFAVRDLPPVRVPAIPCIGIVSAVESPHCVYVQQMTHSPRIMQLTADLAQYVAANPQALLAADFVETPGAMFIFVKRSGDAYRCKLLPTIVPSERYTPYEGTPVLYRVLLIDYGVEMKATAAQLYPLPTEFCADPPYALRCAMVEVGGESTWLAGKDRFAFCYLMDKMYSTTGFSLICVFSPPHVAGVDASVQLVDPQWDNQRVFDLLVEKLGEPVA